MIQFLKLRNFVHKNLEWLLLCSGLFLLAFMSPYENGQSLCLIDLAGFDFCPGKGLGHSIAFFFRGEFQQSVEAHFMGPAAILILTLRILFLIRKNFNTSNKSNKYDKNN
ncbi:MAG: DUF2752 domain-containing protein [Balneolaceae bacterium]